MGSIEHGFEEDRQTDPRIKMDRHFRPLLEGSSNLPLETAFGFLLNCAKFTTMLLEFAVIELRSAFFTENCIFQQWATDGYPICSPISCRVRPLDLCPNAARPPVDHENQLIPI